MPFQVSPSGDFYTSLNRPLLVSATIDSAKILGLPRLRLRNSNGSIYVANKSMLYEPLGLINQHAGFSASGDLVSRKAYINSYVRSR